MPPTRKTFAVDLWKKPEVLSRGSKNHHLSQCRPCVFSTNPEGCPNGVACNFCHYPDHDAKPSPATVLRPKKKHSTPPTDVSVFGPEMKEEIACLLPAQLAIEPSTMQFKENMYQTQNGIPNTWRVHGRQNQNARANPTCDFEQCTFKTLRALQLAPCHDQFLDPGAQRFEPLELGSLEFEVTIQPVMMQHLSELCPDLKSQTATEHANMLMAAMPDHYDD
jgi:hypothetical protein